MLLKLEIYNLTDLHFAASETLRERELGKKKNLDVTDEQAQNGIENTETRNQTLRNPGNQMKNEKNVFDNVSVNEDSSPTTFDHPKVSESDDGAS
ncbi:hypothetical protein TNCV_2544671 [Trichonephila clavipes]|nr:hypothetical protein TNCV_2544671 [Trichonephila clavipes]